MKDRDWWVIIAFSEPPDTFGMRQAKSKKSWFRRVRGRITATEFGQDLASLGIRGVLRKVNPQPTARGKPARSHREAARQVESKRQAIAIYEAGIITGRKQARIAREAAKRRDELKSQANHRAEAEQIRQARLIASKYGGTIH